MTKNKIPAGLGAILILSAGLSAAGADIPQPPTKNSVRERVQSRFLTGSLFIDEDGDGICDLARDHDSDGVPNAQDPDWSRPQDGSGQKFMNGGKAGNALGEKKNFRGGNTWSKQIFRKNQGRLADVMCDGTGPKGSGRKGGRD